MTKSERAINKYTDANGRTWYAYRRKGTCSRTSPSIAMDYYDIVIDDPEYIPEPVTPDGRLAVDAFAEWAREFSEGNVAEFYAMEDDGLNWYNVIQAKLRELHLLPEEKREAEVPGVRLMFSKPVQIYRNGEEYPGALMPGEIYYVKVLDE